MKSLRIGTVPVHLIAADISPLMPGLYVSDEAVLIPRVEESGALEKMIEVIRQIRADAVMIGSEFDLTFFAEHREQIELETGTLIVASPKRTVEIAEDKWLTVNFLREHDLPYADSAILANVDEALETASKWGYPLILKARKGTSSRHVHVIEDEEALEFFLPRTPSAILQKQISTPTASLADEYTCSIFQCANGDLIGPFTARRTLKGGSSWMVEVVFMPALNDLLFQIAKQLPSVGTLNVQLMMGKDGPVPFEFNARFSGTTAVRAHFGFNEPDMALRSYLKGEHIGQQAIGGGLAFRYLEEVFLENVTSDTATTGTQGTSRDWFQA
jgi:carbamoyl-phosphate synthase large subunit